MDDLHRRATELLGQLTQQPHAQFHPGQLEAVVSLVRDRKRVLVVQRTGWGKSAVYFIATRLLRDQGHGPTLLVSPLLALMRNQILAAERMGVRAARIDSSNTADWDTIIEDITAGVVDLLLVSPERLANRQFRESVLDRIGNRAGLVVVDEAHCISDWGHDFRPDYRRIRRLLDALPRTLPVLACTATANDRVVDDVIDQLGAGIEVVRGPLAREGLALQVIDLESPAARLAWLAQTVPQLPGSGIVYCLTKRDAETVATWLADHDVPASVYTGASENREEVEQALLDNDVRVVAATSALGMGFDKPDLTFVIHFQAPSSVIAYYQQVGRAGRQLDQSIGVLLRGREDHDIQDWFIETAFPTADECADVLAVLEGRDGFVGLREIEAEVNVKPTRIANLLKNLEVDGAVVADRQRYQRTPRTFSYDSERIEAITALRRREQEEMAAYGESTSGCRMEFLGAALDDPERCPCGICDLCTAPVLASHIDQALARQASAFLRRRPVTIQPRRRWPAGTDNTALQPLEPGRALCRWGDDGWSGLVKQGKQVDGRFDQALVDALVDLVHRWNPEPRPEWVTWVPSLTHPNLVADLAERFATAIGLPAIGAVTKTRHTEPQKSMHNSAQQLANIQRAFTVSAPVPTSPVFLIDDIVDSRWTVTYVGHLLREAGSGAVVPAALAHSGQS